MAEVEDVEHVVGPVDLTVPASSEHLRVLRLVAASLAASLGLDIDHLDDLRIAVDELCSLLIEHAPAGARLRLTLSGEGGRLVADGALLQDAHIDVIDAVSRLILDGLDIEWSSAAPAPSFTLAVPGRRASDGT